MAADANTDRTRRRLLARLPAAAVALLVAHDVLAEDPPPSRPVGSADRDPAPRPGEHRIRGIELLTAAPLPTLKRFYADGIGFRVLEESDRTLAFAAGATRLAFTRVATGEPFYHFAFNVPPHKLRAAREWQLARSSLVPPREGLREPGWPDDVWHFRHWNAQSIFFFDPAFNIVEYIARSELASDGAGDGTFTTADILYASEIGYVFDEAGRDRAARSIHERLGLSAYPRGTEPWWAMGDERGLVLCLARKGELWGETTPTPVRWGEFPTECTVRGREPGVIEIDGAPYRIRVV
jgi:hypothetical protein